MKVWTVIVSAEGFMWSCWGTCRSLGGHGWSAGERQGPSLELLGRTNEALGSAQGGQKPWTPMPGASGMPKTPMCLCLLDIC